MTLLGPGDSAEEFRPNPAASRTAARGSSCAKNREGAVPPPAVLARAQRSGSDEQQRAPTAPQSQRATAYAR